MVRERNSLTKKNPASAQEQVKYRKANQMGRLLQSHFDKNKQNFSSYVLLLFQVICYFRGPQAKPPIFPNQTISGLFQCYIICTPKQVTVSIFLFCRIQTTITDGIENLGEGNLLPQLCTVNISWPPILADTNTSTARINT